MKSSKIAVFAILLWLITLAVFAWFFIRGNTATGSDNRTAVVLGAGERDLILTEMRGQHLIDADAPMQHGSPGKRHS